MPEQLFPSGGGSNPTTAETLGSSAGSYDLLYQTGGNTSYKSVSVGSVANGRGSVVVKNGSFAVGTGGIAVGNGNGGYGEFAAANSTVSTTGNLTLSGTGSPAPFYSQAAGGSTSVSGTTSVGAGSTLVVSGGTFSTGPLLNGGIVELGSPLTSTAPPTFTASAATLSTNSNLNFDLTDQSRSTNAPTLNLGSGTLTIKNGAIFTVDLTGYHVNMAINSSQTYTLATFGRVSGETLSTFTSQFNANANATSGNVDSAGNTHYSVTASSTSTSIQITVTYKSGEVNVSIGGGVINTYSSSTTSYQYGPDLMYDESEGLFKVWDTVDATEVVTKPANATQDTIGYKEYPTLAGLANAPQDIAMQPPGSKTPTTEPGGSAGPPGGVNAGATADPDVFRDPTSGTFYMAFTGNPITPQPQAGQPSVGGDEIGMAQSSDGGRTFGAYQINSPNGELVEPPNPPPGNGSPPPPSPDFGVAQPSVLFANGYWFMFYTDDRVNSSQTAYIDILRTTDPSFRTGVVATGSFPIYIPGGPATGTKGLGENVGAAYNPSTNQVLLICDQTQPNGPQGNMPGTTETPGASAVTIEHLAFDSVHVSWTFASSDAETLPSYAGPNDTQPFEFGEGLSFMTDSQGNLLESGDGLLFIAGGSYDSKGNYLDGNLDFSVFVL